MQACYLLAYGDTTLNVPLPGADAQILDARPVQPIADLTAAFQQAVETPVGCPPLRALLSPTDEVTVVISDITRFWMRQDLLCPLMLGFLHDELGIPDANIAFLVAVGTHRQQTDDELRRLASPAVYDRVRVVNHDAYGDLREVGRTSRGTVVRVNPLAVGRKVILLGGTVHHFFAGYGGGRKSVLPGISGADTVTQNHLHTLDPLAARSNPLTGCGLLRNNPVHEDMTEAAALVNPVFGLNVVCDGEGRHVALVGGHWRRAWEESCRVVDGVAGVPVAQRADVVIASCGGYPKDINLYQSAKSLLNASRAVREGGTLLLLARCNEGGGPPAFFDWCASQARGTLHTDLRAGYTIAGYIFYLCCEAARHARVRLLTDIPAATLAPMGIEGVADVTALVSGVAMQKRSVVVMPHAASTVPMPR